jgi:hypothetical protein
MIESGFHKDVVSGFSRTSRGSAKADPTAFSKLH